MKKYYGPTESFVHFVWGSTWADKYCIGDRDAASRDMMTYMCVSVHRRWDGKQN